MQKPKKVKEVWFASCTRGLEELLDQELEELNIKERQLIAGGVFFRYEHFFKPLFHSRLVSRLFKVLYEFPVENEKDFSFFGRQIKWKALMKLEQSFKFEVQADKNLKVKSLPYCGLLLKDCLVDHFRDNFNQRPSVKTSGPDLSFVVKVFQGQATLMLDIVGKPLYERGYRDSYFPAPLKENLAAALVMASGWDKKSTFCDPLCGSGTILIEALMMAMDLPPCLLKLEKPSWKFLQLLFFQKDPKLQEKYEKILKALKRKSRPLPFKLYGSDQSEKALESTVRQLRNIAAEDQVILEQKDILNDRTKLPIITNPPYGKRLKVDEDFFKHLGRVSAGRKLTCLMPKQEWAKHLGPHVEQKFIFYHGGIKLFVYSG